MRRFNNGDMRVSYKVNKLRSKLTFQSRFLENFHGVQIPGIRVGQLAHQKYLKQYV